MNSALTIGALGVTFHYLCNPMKIVNHIANAKRTLFSFEILPPEKGTSLQNIYQSIDQLMEFSPSFINVTYHREDYILRKREDGSMDKVYTRKRPGTVAICAAIQNKYKLDAVPHMICGGFSKEETENALIDLNFLGIDNILALRGDKRKGEETFEAEIDGNKNSIDLIHQIKNMNAGIFQDDELQNADVSNFCIGAAAYPEVHEDAPNKEFDLKFLKRKVEAGAEFLITQMFFDNQKYFEFVNQCREMGITIPIIPGLKPLATTSQIENLSKIFSIDFPQTLVEQVKKAKDNSEVKQIGIDWCIQQCKELTKNGVPVLHFYTMSRSDQTKKICEAIF